MANEHYDAIDAEFCYAEGGSVTRIGGQVKFASIQTGEKIPRAITVTSKGISGHGSVPLESNALAHLGDAVGKIAAWTPPMRINETTAAYFKRWPRVDARGSEALSRAAESPIRRCRAPRTTTCARTSRGTGRCCALRCHRR
jgi:hypothetical protein